MKNTNRDNKLLRVLLCVCFVLTLMGSMFSICITGIFSADAVEHRLQAHGFYTFAHANVTEELTSLQGVIGIKTEDLQAAVTKEEIEPLLRAYTYAVSRHLLSGDQTDETIAFTSDALYALVCNTITAEHYNGNTAQMEADRRDAYTDLTDTVDRTLRFFPTSLYATATDILQKGGVQLSTVYTAVKVMRIAMWPLIAVTLLLGGCIVLCSKDRKALALRAVGGCTFLTGTAVFMLTVFLRQHSLLSRLSLGDGLLKRYIMAVFQNGETVWFTTALIVFCVGAVLLLGGILWQVFANNTCKQQESVIE